MDIGQGMLDFPLYPGAAERGRMDGRTESGRPTSTICLATPDSVDQAYAHYLAVLPAAGWILDAGDLSLVKAISFRRGGRRGTLTITGDRAETIILINVAE